MRSSSLRRLPPPRRAAHTIRTRPAAARPGPAAGVPARQPAPRGSVPGAPPAMHLVADVSHGEWRMPTGDYGGLRYSTLDTINTTNAKDLHVVTTFPPGIPPGHAG